MAEPWRKEKCPTYGSQEAEKELITKDKNALCQLTLPVTPPVRSILLAALSAVNSAVH